MLPLSIAAAPVFSMCACLTLLTHELSCLDVRFLTPRCPRLQAAVPHAAESADAEDDPPPPSFRRLLSFVGPEAGWIFAGLASLLIRLPFCLAMPHYVSETMAAVVRDQRPEAAVRSCLFA